MQFKFRLSHKGLSLILISLLFQLLLFAILAGLHSQAEQEALAAYHSSRISETTNKLVRDIFDIASLSQDELPIIANTGFEEHAKSIRDDIANLRAAVQGDPAKMAIVDRSTKFADNAYSYPPKTKLYLQD